MRPAIVGCLAAAVLSCGPARAPALPAGPVSTVALDGEHALAFVAPDRRGSIALIDAAGVPLWTAPVADEESTWLFERAQALVGEHLIGLGEHITVFARADGRVLARRPLMPASLARRLHEPEAVGFELADGLVVSRVQNLFSTWITAYDPVADREVWQIGRPAFTDTFDLGTSAAFGLRIGEPRMHIVGEEGERRFKHEIFEVVDARTGARRARLTGRRHCVADGTLFVVDDELRVTAFDIEGEAPRTIVPRLALPPARGEWDLEACHHHNQDVWLTFTDFDATLVVGIDGEHGRERTRHGLCDDSFHGPLPGRWLVVQPLAQDGPLAVYDVERGRLAWVQDRSIDPTHYSSKYIVGDVLYLRGLVGGPGASREIWRLVALDRRTGEILGAAAIVGPSELDMADIRDGEMWLFQRELTNPGAVPLVRLDARTLRPRGPLPHGLEIVDTTTEALAARRTPSDHEPGLTWDPAATDEPRQRCRPPGEPDSDGDPGTHARERAP